MMEPAMLELPPMLGIAPRPLLCEGEMGERLSWSIALWEPLLLPESCAVRILSGFFRLFLCALCFIWLLEDILNNWIPSLLVICLFLDIADPFSSPTEPSSLLFKFVMFKF